MLATNAMRGRELHAISAPLAGLRTQFIQDRAIRTIISFAGRDQVTQHFDDRPCAFMRSATDCLCSFANARTFRLGRFLSRQSLRSSSICLIGKPRERERLMKRSSSPHQRALFLRLKIETPA